MGCHGVMADLLHIENVSKHYGGVCALNNARFTLRAGDRDYLPAHTKHSAVVSGDEPLIYLIGAKY